MLIIGISKYNGLPQSKYRSDMCSYIAFLAVTISPAFDNDVQMM